MIDWVSALAGGTAFVVALAAFYWLLLKTTSLGDDEYDTEATKDRLEFEGRERHERVGFRHRISRQTPMTKAFLASIILFLSYLTLAVYRVAATGSPGDAPYTGYVEYGIYGLVCVVAGIWFKRRQDRKAGELQIMLERGEGNDRKTIYYDRSMVRETGDGTKLVPEFKSQWLGIFWRPQLVGDDPELRDSDHRLPDDLVMWEIPIDESAAWDEVRGEVTVRAKDTSPVKNPNRLADYEIVPSDRKSKRELRDLENENIELEADLKQERIQVAILTEQISEIEAILTNEEDAGLQRIQEAKNVLEPEQPATENRFDERRENGSRAPATHE